MINFVVIELNQKEKDINDAARCKVESFTTRDIIPTCRKNCRLRLVWHER